MRKYFISRFTTYSDGRSLLRARLIPPPIDAKTRELPRLFTQSTHFTVICYLPEYFESGTIVSIPDELVNITNATFHVEIVPTSDDEFIMQRKP